MGKQDGMTKCMLNAHRSQVVKVAKRLRPDSLTEDAVILRDPPPNTKSTLHGISVVAAEVSAAKLMDGNDAEHHQHHDS